MTRDQRQAKRLAEAAQILNRMFQTRLQGDDVRTMLALFFHSSLPAKRRAIAWARDEELSIAPRSPSSGDATTREKP